MYTLHKIPEGFLVTFNTEHYETHKVIDGMYSFFL
jgi:hypothetical protein